MADLKACEEKFPLVYQEKFIKPLISFLEYTGEMTVNYYLHLYGEDCVIADISRPVLQRCNLDDLNATDAFQEVVSDLYDGFLSEEDREDVKHPDYCVVAPIVSWIPSWSRTDDGTLSPNGPCTLTADDLKKEFGIETGIVNLPVQSWGLRPLRVVSPQP